jgi:hypothetical protein
MACVWTAARRAAGAVWHQAGRVALVTLCAAGVAGAVLPPVGRAAVTVMAVLSEVLAIAGMVTGLVIMLAGLAGLAVLGVRLRRRTRVVVNLTATRPYRVTVVREPPGPEGKRTGKPPALGRAVPALPRAGVPARRGGGRS